jgi:WXG100 family type VII secretion target
MTNDNKVYDYGVLEDCVSMLSQKANEIESHAQDLDNARNQLLPNWTGSAADNYATLAGEMNKNLGAQRDFISRLQQTVNSSASAMQEADRSGAKRIG